MKRPVFLTILPFAVITLAMLTLLADAQSRRSPPAFKPEAKIGDLMMLNKDLNGTIREALMGTPDWKQVAYEARLIGEIANVVQYHQPTAVADWWSFAGTFRDGARKVVAAAEASDLNAAREAQKALMQTCKQCHDKFRK